MHTGQSTPRDAHSVSQVKRVREALESNLQTKATVQQHIAAVRAVPASYAESPEMHTADFEALINSTTSANTHNYR